MSEIIETNTKTTATGNRHVMSVWTLPKDDRQIEPRLSMTPTGEELVFPDGHHVILHWSRTKVACDILTSEQTEELISALAVAAMEVRHKDYGGPQPPPIQTMRQQVHHLLQGKE